MVEGWFAPLIRSCRYCGAPRQEYLSLAVEQLRLFRRNYPAALAAFHNAAAKAFPA